MYNESSGYQTNNLSVLKELEIFVIRYYFRRPPDELDMIIAILMKILTVSM